jgi:hypothetical protein
MSDRCGVCVRCGPCGLLTVVGGGWEYVVVWKVGPLGACTSLLAVAHTSLQLAGAKAALLIQSLGGVCVV